MPRDTIDGRQMLGARIILKALEEQGVEVVFGYPGGAVLPIYDEIFKQNRIRHILVRHEQGAVHAAEGYARSTGKVGVVLVTSGPGATNAVTGLTDALMDSIPVVCLTGQVPTHLIGNDAFQEADTIGITRPCTKHNYLVKDPNDLAKTIHEAFYVARSGRPGPVVVDLPKDVVMEKGAYATAPRGIKRQQHKTYRPAHTPDPASINAVVDLMVNAERPLFYTGGGVINAGPGASKTLTDLVKDTGFPITSTLMGLGAYPASGPKWLGMVGMHGTYESNMAMHGCDVMINIGARFDDRVTGNLKYFSPGSKKIHVDIDQSSINKNVIVDIPVVGDAGVALKAIFKAWKARTTRPKAKAMKAWWADIERWKAKDCLSYTQTGSVIKPQYAIQRLFELTKKRDTFITTEVGQHQMWAAQFCRFDKPNHWLTSGGLGTMGYGLPAAIGAQIGNPKGLVVDVAGEASILMNIQELSTAVQYRLPVKVFIINNQYMGMVRQWQELLHGGRYAESYTDSLPDFVKLAEAYGMTGLRVQDPAKVDDTIKEMMAIDGPVIVDVCVDQKENCYPMIPSGAAHNHMLLGPEDEGEQKITGAGMALV
ncbi:MAG: acetolactate synthase 3 large subunit [Rhodospirillaceae bacterium]|jgi:acetolactate synthase I/II/III large subunit|nr:acetolactate synthase 3 large subunit [Rhodospirillaceae bacterium]MBT5239948.1 acetolactate synthase 3 large subunit [Rhodospirillaceae bacterium]MBT5564390.1 acetolactate synthase 3 large subunit [Rhodospirillaceae bacterium]MBT6960065.1 acetolactate synthase 3 large subunit [Rhodospirillaceae bacterium]MBT7451007.1 acetolactate synthase 3 large subunit [Rhodospirillaceae bacterium]